MLSVVLVVHREQGFIEECVRSILAGAPADLELLAVDDASPDHGPAILDRLAAEDERMRVVHLEKRRGLGAARNLALEQVTGDHVWFVETTDLVAPGGLALVQGDFDVLLLRHTRRDALGRDKPGPKRVDAGAAAPDVWRMVLRRSLVGRFSDGLHGELTATWPALLAAERTERVAEPVYIRRRPPNAVRHGKRADVLAHYEALLPDQVIRDAAARHLLRLAGGDAEFIRAAGALLQRYPAGAPAPRDGRRAA